MLPKKIMPFVCAWCQKELTPSNADPLINNAESHSMCLKCIRENEIFEEIDISKSQYKIPWGETKINRNNVILNYRSSNKVQGNFLNRNFKEIIPLLSVKEIRNKLGGLRRRKSNGHVDFCYLLKNQQQLDLVQIELSHNVNEGCTTIKIEQVFDE